MSEPKRAWSCALTFDVRALICLVCISIVFSALLIDFSLTRRRFQLNSQIVVCITFSS